MARLDSQVPFYIGDTEAGVVYITGTTDGIEGRMLGVDEDNVFLLIWVAPCSVKFG